MSIGLYKYSYVETREKFVEYISIHGITRNDVADLAKSL